ncbi:negative elongation factor A [Trichogramma pretiosum]|uniref:HDAg domain-containing protein n=1 Tax=Trichogramma kaykai TaxID=54128 RepID=A0ABD2WVG5_9HYME|nr:negative elongation factor A [Trichogramma pretiosum]
MANVRDSDTSLWLHNKLGTSNDSWTGSSICSQLNVEVLRNIKDCFSDLQLQVKLKLLLSFFHIHRSKLEEWKLELEEIIEIAAIDTDLWVSMLAELMKTFPSTGSLNTDPSDFDDHRPLFGDLITDLRKLLKKQNDPNMLPLECHFLNHKALTSVVGNLPPPTKHFALKHSKKSKSAALRDELRQKSFDAQSNLKKNVTPTVPVRSRGIPRKMTDTTPLRGIPSRLPGSAFRSPALGTSPVPQRTPVGGRIRKDGGIKLLDISEQPLGYVQAKRRKRQQEQEEQQKKAEEAKAAAAAAQATAQAAAAAAPAEETATPEYAQGLAPIAAPATPAAPAVSTPTTPTTPHLQPYSTPKTTASVPVAVVAPNPKPVVASTAPPTTVVNSTTTVVTPVESNPVTVQTVKPTVQIVRPPATVTQIPISSSVQQPAAAANARKGLSLTRDQMLEAQEMFRTANKVTRPEKALILGFMAGSRDNPCPKLGNIVTVMLSENLEEVPQPDGTSVLVQVETHFQMNYTNGEWKRIKKNRRIVQDESAVVTNQATNAAK